MPKTAAKYRHKYHVQSLPQVSRPCQVLWATKSSKQKLNVQVYKYIAELFYGRKKEICFRQFSGTKHRIPTREESLCSEFFVAYQLLAWPINFQPRLYTQDTQREKAAYTEKQCRGTTECSRPQLGHFPQSALVPRRKMCPLA